MFYVMGESIDDEYFEFTPAGKTLEEVRKECQELLETLDGGSFDIYDITDSEDIYLDTVEY